MAEKPAGNAKTEDWKAYAISEGYSEDQLKDKTRDEIRDLVEAAAGGEVESDPNQVNEPDPGQVENTETPAADTNPAPTEQGPDYQRFLTGNPAASAGGGETPQVQEPVKPVVPTGREVKVDNGQTRAKVIRGTYQLLDNNKIRHYAHKGDTVIASAEKIQHGVKHGFLKEL